MLDLESKSYKNWLPNQISQSFPHLIFKSQTRGILGHSPFNRIGDSLGEFRIDLDGDFEIRVWITGEDADNLVNQIPQGNDGRVGIDLNRTVEGTRGWFRRSRSRVAVRERAGAIRRSRCRGSRCLHGRSRSGRIIHHGLLTSGIGLSDARFNQQQRVVDLDIRVAKLEPLEGIATLAVSRAEEIPAGRAFNDRLL